MLCPAMKADVPLSAPFQVVQATDRLLGAIVQPDERMAEVGRRGRASERPFLYRGLSQQAQATLRRRECAGLRNW